MLRHEASVSSVADASCLSMTVYSGLLLKKVFPFLSGLDGKDCNHRFLFLSIAQSFTTKTQGSQSWIYYPL
ncbi:hypothetical protein ACFOG5_14005 [Pedobacter fastidiosus]|uniref:hypothetical protein n=1 Tax=Pedobacter fastidiosus TaxID=2765361 RepID=UPI0036122781